MTWPAVAAVVRAQLRRRWRALVLIGLLGGLVGATAVSAIALARRTTTAYDRLGEVTALDDARGTVLRHRQLVDEIVSLPQVTERWTGGIGVAKLADSFTFLGITAGPEAPSPLMRPVVLDGRPPGAAEEGVLEVALRDDFQREFDIELGTELPVRFLSEDDYFRFDTGFEGGDVHGPELVLRVVGTVRLAGGTSSLPPAFASAEGLRAHRDAFIASSWFVRLRDGAAGFDGFEREVEELSDGFALPPEADEFSVAEITDTTVADATVDNTAGLLGRALLALAAAVAAAGALALAQTFARHHAGDAADREVEAALGFTAAERRTATAATAAVPAVIAAVLTGAGAVAAGRLEPIGAIHQYEPHPGVAVNVAVVAAGVAITLALVLGLGTLTGVVPRGRRTAIPARESSFVNRATRLGGGPETVMGLRFALEPGRGARAVPVRSAIAGAVVGVAGVVAGLVFVASLDRLVTSPSRSGIPFDVLVADVTAEDMEPFLDHPLVSGVTMSHSAPVVVDGRTLDAHALVDLVGTLEVDVVVGRLPRTPDEIALGLRAADDAGKGVGDTVTATDRDGSEHELAIVGLSVVPPLSGEQLGLNALLTPEGLDRAGRAASFDEAAVQARPGADPAELVEVLADRFEADAERVPTEVENLRALGGLPAAVAGVVGTIAVVALVNALVVAVRRRRSDLALLRSIGFTTRQSSSSVLVMALTIAAIGVAVGVPAGMAAGATLWRVTAEGAFVATDPLVRWDLVLAVTAATAVVALGAAAVPARRAARQAPAALLRAE